MTVGATVEALDLLEYFRVAPKTAATRRSEAGAASKPAEAAATET